MNIYKKIPESDAFKNPVLTIGSFDGVHLGHRRIISTLLNTARKKSGNAVLLTFSTHPRKILTPETPPMILTTSEEKIRAIADLGVKNIIVLDFTREMADMEAIDFFNRFILKRIGTIDIVMGYDHAFGKDRQGNFDFLKGQSRSRGFRVTRVEPKNFNSKPISSTWIRSELEDGDISLANSMLGRRYTLSGTVVKGEGRGRAIGFPTANIMPHDADKVCPGNGVYAVAVVVNRKTRHCGMLNIGTNPTFMNTGRTVEVNIFDFDESIYGGEIEIEFAERMRDEKRFESPEHLIEQLKKDRLHALDIFKI